MKIKIKNFQAIKDAEVEAEKLTVIVGPSDKGKSSFIRAVKSAFFNNKGDWFIKDGEKSTSVQVTGDGFDLIWEKGKGVNKQIINGEEYSKIGSSTPEVIQDITKFRELNISDDVSIIPQIQGQHEYAFLLNKTEGQISSAISYLANTDRILAATKLCAIDLKNTKSSLKLEKEQCDNIQKQLTALDKDFVDTSLLFDNLQKTEKDLVVATALIQDIENILNSIETLKLASDSFAKIKEPGSVDITNPLELLAVIENYLKLVFVETLSIPKQPQDVSQDVQDSISLIETIETYLKALYVTSIKLPSIGINTISNIDADIVAIRDMENYLILKSDMVDILNNTSKINDDFNDVSIKIKALEKDLGVCPTCNQEFGNHNH
jgi:DNA repair ATPase RecN